MKNADDDKRVDVGDDDGFDERIAASRITETAAGGASTLPKEPNITIPTTATTCERMPERVACPGSVALRTVVSSIKSTWCRFVVSGDWVVGWLLLLSVCAKSIFAAWSSPSSIR